MTQTWYNAELAVLQSGVMWCASMQLHGTHGTEDCVMTDKCNSKNLPYYNAIDKEKYMLTKAQQFDPA